MKRICRGSFCGALVEGGGFCPKCKPKYQRKDIQRRRKRTRIYDRTDWRKLRKWKLAEHPFCIECGRPGEVVDHIVRIKDEHDPLFLDPNNLQTMCQRCHNRKRGREAHE